MNQGIIRHIKTLRVFAEDIEPVSKQRLAAAVLYKGKIISIGFNQMKTHPFAVEYAKNDEAIYLHAETDAIYKAKKKLTEQELRKATLIIVRAKNDINSNKHFGLAKPCPGCARCIEDHKIKTVIYTDESEMNKMKFIVEHADYNS